MTAAISVMVAADTDTGQRAAPERPAPAETREGGFRPPPMYMHHLRPDPARIVAMPQAPVSWDWRSSGDVTSVKDQNPYGTCWAFAALGNLESSLHINHGMTRDYSEHNIVSCGKNRFYEDDGYFCNTGGNAYIAANHLSQYGSINESIDTYPGYCNDVIYCYDPSPWIQLNVKEFRAITGEPPVSPADNEAIKNAVMAYGPVITSMYSSWGEFSAYDTDTCLTYSGTETPNHSVLIVGWNDTLCGGTEGAWIVKNSWGPSWGDAGYFYIRYGHANIGSWSSVITGYQFHDDREKIYSIDEFGFTLAVGWTGGPDYEDWGLVKYTPEWSGYLHSVDFWTTSSPCDYRIIVYDDFISNTPQNVLGGPYDGSLTEAGFYSIDLPDSIEVDWSDPVYIAVRFTTPGYEYCLPFDSYGPMETDISWGSTDGTTWYAQDSSHPQTWGDLCIRGRVVPDCLLPIPQLDVTIFHTEVVTLGMADLNRYWVEVRNRADVPPELFEPAPDLYPYTPDNSRGRFDIQNAQSWATLSEYGELDSSSELDSLYFDVNVGLSQPDSIIMGLSDGRCYVMYGSNTARVPATTCGQPVLVETGYEEVSWSDPHWDIRIGLENTGIRIAYLVSGMIVDGPSWLLVEDPYVTYGRITLDEIDYDSGDVYTLDMSAYPGGPFTIELEVTCEDVCGTVYQFTVPVELELTTTGTDTPPIERVYLAQNFPNPFNPATTIAYELPDKCPVRLSVYDVAGRLVRVLVDGNIPAGRHETAWDGTDRAGRTAASGIYFYRIDAGGTVITKKMALLR
jgi:C1A family cysteine protease